MLTYQDAVAIINTQKYIDVVVYVPTLAYAPMTTMTRTYDVLDVEENRIAILGLERLDTAQVPCKIFTIQLTHVGGATLMRLEFGRGHTCPDGEQMNDPHVHIDDDLWPHKWKGHPLLSPDDTRVIVEQFLVQAGIDGRVEPALLWHS